MEATRDSNLPCDAQIVQALRSGDVRALEILVREYREPLTRYADHVLGSPGEGEDVVQEVFIRLWTRRETLGGQGSLRSLLYAMTRNAAIDERRRVLRAARRATAGPGPSMEASPFERMAERELAERAEAAVAALPARRQEVFRLVRESGLSYEEVTQVMGISLQTVANHMSLALAALRRALIPLVDEPAAGADRVAVTRVAHRHRRLTAGGMWGW